MFIDLNQIQSTIDYYFKNEDLLQQAFVRRSYSEENGGQNNEVLEFIGDKALDLVVINLMMKKFGVITEDKAWDEFKLKNPKYFKTKLDEGKFTNIKKDLVEKKALATAMDNLGFHSQLIMGKGDIKKNVQNEDSVKEDLFEAIIGAVALDCNYNMDILVKVVSNMIDFDSYFNGEIEDENYVGIIQQWFQNNKYALPKYEYHKTQNGFNCYLILLDNIIIKGIGCSQAKARMNCAYHAYIYLEENGYIIDPVKEVLKDVNFEQALRQMNELYQKQLITKPIYDFKQDYDKDGHSIWICSLHLEDSNKTFTESATNKKDAQRLVTYELLLYLADKYDENIDYACKFLG